MSSANPPTSVRRRVVDPPWKPVTNARRFIDDLYTHKDGMLLRSHAGTQRAWSGSAWPELSQDDLTADIYEYFEDTQYIGHDNTGRPVLKDFNVSISKAREIAAAIAAVSHLPDTRSMPFWIGEDAALSDRPAPSGLVPMANGLLQVTNRLLHPPTPNFFCPYALPYPYDSGAPSPERFLQFLDELFGDDQESKDLLQEFIGYLLVPDTSQQKMLLLVGPPRSGKGTISRMTRDLLGHHNVAGPTLASLGTNFGLQPMIDKPVAIISDARLSGRTDNAVVVERLLSITGEDALTVDRKYKTAWTGPLPCRLVIISNELPRLDDASGALASRFLVLQLTDSFLGKEEHDLSATLAQELSGILLWALDGLERLRERGHFLQPEKAGQVVRDLAELSSPIRSFINERCVSDPLSSVGVGELFDEWKNWSWENNVPTGTKQTFGRDLHAADPTIETKQERVGDSRQRRYRGIELSRDDTRYTQLWSEQ